MASNSISAHVQTLYPAIAQSYLNSFDFESVDSFDVTAQALRSLTVNEIRCHVASGIKGRIHLIKGLIEQADSKETKSAILKLVSNKIAALNSLTLEQKISSIYAPIALLPARLQAEYHQLANEYLMGLPFERMSDFADAIEALKALNEPLSEHRVAPAYKPCVLSLQEMFKFSDLYAQPEYQTAFRAVLQREIASKINELTNLSDELKQGYIEHTAKLKQTALANRAKMHAAKPPAPGSSAHTITFLQWWSEEEQRFIGIQHNFQQTEFPGAEGLIRSQASPVRECVMTYQAGFIGI